MKGGQEVGVDLRGSALLVGLQLVCVASVQVRKGSPLWAAASLPHSAW